VLATGNAGKVRELRELLDGCGWEVLAPADIALSAPDVIEGGRSYLENATLKAIAFSRAARLPALADDSGLEVDALDGRPGVFSARYGGRRASDDHQRCGLLLDELRDVPAGRRAARFRASIVLALPGGATVSREGTVEGRIAAEPRGANGFGYDPVFELPDGRTMAQIGDEKSAFSHRALAIRAMIKVLKELA
jgi:XTP/dITP diphosphohydrolase